MRITLFLNVLAPAPPNGKTSTSPYFTSRSSQRRDCVHSASAWRTSRRLSMTPGTRQCKRRPRRWATGRRRWTRWPNRWRWSSPSLDHRPLRTSCRTRYRQNQIKKIKKNCSSAIILLFTFFFILIILLLGSRDYREATWSEHPRVDADWGQAGDRHQHRKVLQVRGCNLLVGIELSPSYSI